MTRPEDRLASAALLDDLGADQLILHHARRLAAGHEGEPGSRRGLNHWFQARV